MRKVIKNVLAGVSALCMTVVSLTAITSNAFTMDDNFTPVVADLNNKSVVYNHSSTFLSYLADTSNNTIIDNSSEYDYIPLVPSVNDNGELELSVSTLSVFNHSGTTNGYTINSLGIVYDEVWDAFIAELPNKSHCDIIYPKYNDIKDYVITEECVYVKESEYESGLHCLDNISYVMNFIVDDTSNFNGVASSYSTEVISNVKAKGVSEEDINKCVWFDLSDESNKLLIGSDDVIKNTFCSYLYKDSNKENIKYSNSTFLYNDNDFDKPTYESYNGINLKVDSIKLTSTSNETFYSDYITVEVPLSVAYSDGFVSDYYRYSYDTQSDKEQCIEYMREVGDYTSYVNKSYEGKFSNADSYNKDTDNQKYLFTATFKPKTDKKVGIYSPSQFSMYGGAWQKYCIEMPSTMKGDSNNDGRVDILDVITVNRVVLGKDSLNAQFTKNVDINNDGKPDSTDSLAIMKYIVGLSDSLE